LPKVHKPSLAWRPITGAFNSPTTAISKWLARCFRQWFVFIQNKVGSRFTILRDNQELLLLFNHVVNPNDFKVIAAGDFTSFYTKIRFSEIKEAILILGKWFWPPDMGLSLFQVAKLTMTVIRMNYFDSCEGAFRQISGIAMGTNCAPDLANLVGLSWELIAFSNNHEFKNAIINNKVFFRRYIDDFIVLAKEGINIPDFFNIYPPWHSINWAISIDGSKIPFLDLHISLLPFHTKRYSKFPRSVQFPDWTSNHPRRTLVQTISNEARRLALLCSEEKDWLLEITDFAHFLMSRKGYPREVIFRQLNDVFYVEARRIITHPNPAPPHNHSLPPYPLRPPTSLPPPILVAKYDSARWKHQQPDRVLHQTIEPLEDSHIFKNSHIPLIARAGNRNIASLIQNSKFGFNH
jgi:hypothetical protein